MQTKWLPASASASSYTQDCLSLPPLTSQSCPDPSPIDSERESHAAGVGSINITGVVLLYLPYSSFRLTRVGQCILTLCDIVALCYPLVCPHMLVSPFFGCLFLILAPPTTCPIPPSQCIHMVPLRNTKGRSMFMLQTLAAVKQNIDTKSLFLSLNVIVIQKTAARLAQRNNSRKELHGPSSHQPPSTTCFPFSLRSRSP